MKCPRCQQENPPQAKFCLECATPLALRCANCGTQLPAGAKFCFECATAVSVLGSPPRFASPDTYTPKHLAERIINSKAALEGERKQVTVLFADLKGSMELLAHRDPEEARKLLDPVLERMMEAVHRYEGTVNQVMGDGIMALFGAPLAHEDHAVQACYAALRMQENVKKYAEEVRRSHAAVVKIRVGLNSGEVVVRAIGGDLHMDYTAVGQTTHLAARMEQIADPGAIVITPETLALAEGYVEVRSLGSVPVKGLVDPVEVFEVTGAGPARTRFQAATQRGLTRFVGRDAELVQLHRAQQLAGSDHGQVAAIVGEAGVGKSRLVYELTHSHRSLGWLVLESACVSYGKATSYWPVIALLKVYFKIQERDNLRDIREKVTGKLLTLDESLKPALPALLALLDVPVDDAAWRALDPGRRRQQTLDAVKRLLLREACEQPLLLIMEDLHWIDTETQALLDGLVESLGSARLFLLVNYRPEYQHTWHSQTFYSQLPLGALPAQGAGELLDALLGEDPRLVPLKRLLIKRGNPFFLEESVRTLVETEALEGQRGRYRLTRPVETIQIPATVHAMLAARIDRLLPEHKHLLGIASVVGKDVPLALLRAIADLSDEALHGGLDRLQAAEFVDASGRYPDLVYSFKHALTHEVTYRGLLHERRRELHARIVDAIESLHRDRLGEQIERLAYHAVRGDLRERAVHYLHQAGAKAATRSALKDARASFEEALGILGALPESRSTLEQGFEIRLDLRPVLFQLGERWQMQERLREAERLAETLEDDGRRGRVYAFVTMVKSLSGELDEALASGARALEIAGRTGDLRVRLLASSFLTQAHHYRGEYQRVIELASDNLAALPGDWENEHLGSAAPVSILDRVWLAMSLAQLGRFAEAAPHEAEAIRLAEATFHPFNISLAYLAASTRCLLEGDWTKARSRVEHWIGVARTGNVEVHLPWAVSSAAWAFAQLGETGEALERLREGQQLLEHRAAHGTAGNLGWIYYMLGRACLLIGRLDEARCLGDRAVEFCAHRPGITPYAQHLLGDIATYPDCFDAESGEAHYRQSLALAEPRGMRPLVAHCHLGLGKLYGRTGQREQAQEHLATATTMYRDMGMTYWLEKAEAEVREIG